MPTSGSELAVFGNDFARAPPDGDPAAPAELAEPAVTDAPGAPAEADERVALADDVASASAAASGLPGVTLACTCRSVITLGAFSVTIVADK